MSKNLSTASDNFEVNRRVVFYNGITGDYMLSIEGLCSKDNSSTANTLGIVCKVGPNQYKKHLLGLSDNVTFFIEQIDGVKASPYFYRVTFKPSVIAPDIDIR
uniref:Phage protein n=1 Tax=Serratia marcescens TaxID=615 RepID=A0A345IPS2_SERMA|nr:phage protein [Serratia marcescens]